MGKNYSDIEPFLESLKGKTEVEARELCKDTEYTVRKVREDGEHFIITMDLRFNRINLELENGLIVKCDIG